MKNWHIKSLRKAKEERHKNDIPLGYMINWWQNGGNFNEEKYLQIIKIKEK